MPIDFSDVPEEGYQFGLAGTFNKNGYFFNIRFASNNANSYTNSNTGWKHNFLFIVITYSTPNVKAVNSLHITAYIEDGVTEYNGGTFNGAQGEITIDPISDLIIMTIGSITGGILESTKLSFSLFRKSLLFQK